VVSWEIGSGPRKRRIVVMWDAPFSFDLNSNWMAIAITRENKSHRKEWYNILKENIHSPDFTHRFLEKYEITKNQISISDDEIEVTGVMDKEHHATIRICVKPK